MKTKIVSGAAIAVAAVAMALSGAAPASAKDKPHRADKTPAEKPACGGKNGCPGMDKAKAEGSAAPAASNVSSPIVPKATEPK